MNRLSTYIKPLLVIYFFILSFQLFSQRELKFEKIELPPDVINSNTFTVYEDSKGFIWFGTADGLLLYDGYKVQTVDNVNDKGVVSNFPLVHTIVEDSKGLLWIGTRFGVYIYNRTKGTSEKPDNDIISKSACRALYLNRKKEIIVGTEDGLFICNSDKEVIEQYIHRPNIKESISNSIVRSIYEDKNENVWVGTYNGLNLLNRKKNKISRFRLQKKDSVLHSNNLIISINPMKGTNDSILIVGTETGLCFFNTRTYEFTQYKKTAGLNSISNDVAKTTCMVNDKIWIGTDLGLNIFDIETQTFSHYFHDYSNTYSISSNVIIKIFLDSRGNLWFGTDNGVNKYIIKENGILYNQFYESAVYLKGGLEISDVERYKNGDIWLATKEGAIKYDSVNNSYLHFLPPDILHNKLNNIIYTDNEELWISSPGGINVYEYKKKKFKYYVSKANKKNALSSNYINIIRKNSKGKIYLVVHNKSLFKAVFTKNGVDFINLKSDRNNNALSSDFITDIAFDENDNMWVASNNGLKIFNPTSGVFKQVGKNSKHNSANEHVNDLFFDHNNILWIASAGGLSYWDSDKNKKIQLKDFPGNIRSIIVSDSILYYISGNNFFFYNRNSKKHIRIPNSEIGLQKLKKLKPLSKRAIYILANEGFSVFDISEYKLSRCNPKVQWTSFSILNNEIKPYKPYNSHYILEKHINQTESVTLEYSENTFSVEFSSLLFDSKSKGEYKYILEGYEKNWQTIKNGKAYVSYTQVRPGTYKLRVKAANKYGIYDNQERVLTIEVKPPIFLSNWALFIYAVIIISLFIMSRMMLITREKKKGEMELQKLKQQKSEELVEIKTRFFTNITHELKTPLTLISSPVEDLLTKKLDDSTLRSLRLVKRNTERLKRLVNQILDIRKLEAGAEKLKIQKYDIVKFSNRILEQFKEESVKRNIFLHFQSEPITLMMWFDMVKIEKVLFNLLSNAFKFTPDGGTIRLTITLDTKNENHLDYVFISVEDTGSGIKNEAQEKIFERYSTLTSKKYTDQQGTGIGLSLIREYVTMHSGTIQLKSEINKGSKFTLSLPKNKSLLSNYDDISHKAEIKEDEKKQEEISKPEKVVVVVEPEESEKLKILVVEDDTDMREFIASGFSEKYEVFESENGKEGQIKAIQEMPDVIISDVMMPKMTGFELCEKLKTDLRTCHIPIILLTAKTGMENKIEGIETGADDYIQKPFNFEYLKKRVKNLIKQRELLKKSFLQKDLIEPSDIKVNSLDKKFLEDLVALIEKEIDNSELNVQLLSKLMGLSKTNLYRKIKALTGQTAIEFIKTTRLKRAAQLLKNKELNVTDVMYMVGFSHRSYFTKSFKELFGETPKVYADSHNKT